MISTAIREDLHEMMQEAVGTSSGPFAYRAIALPGRTANRIGRRKGCLL